MKRTTIILLLLFVLSRLSGQSSNFVTRHLTVSNGLPSGITYDGSWDSSGFLWISTLKGIARYDGIRVRPFTRNNDRVILSGYSSPIFKDEHGNDYFGDDVNYIYGLRNSRPVLVDSSLRSGIRGNNHFAFSLPRRFWNPVLIHFSDSFSYTNEAIAVDKDHFVLAFHNKLLRYDLGSGKYTSLQEFAADIKLFKMGPLLYLYEKKRSVFAVGFSGPDGRLSLEPVNSSLTLREAEIYWRTGMTEAILVEKGSAYLLHLRNGNFIKELICDDLPNDIFINNIKYDPASQTAMVACDGDGIYLYKKKLLHTYVQRSANILAKPYSFYSQIEMQPGELWLDLLKKLDLQDNSFSPLDSSLAFQSAYRLNDSLALFHTANYHDQKYYVWSYSFDTKKLTRRFDMAHTESGSFAMTENRLFFACDDGIFELSKVRDSLYYSFSVIGPDSLNIARIMIELRPGYLLFCGGNCVYGFDIHSKRVDSLIINHSINHFSHATAYKGYCFLTQYGVGIGVLKGGKYKPLPLDNTQFLRSGHGIYVDGDNDAWIGADAGLFRIPADSLVAEFNRPDDAASDYLKCEYFGKEDGMELSELNGSRQGSVVRLKDGRLSFVGINGIVTADIANKPFDSARARIFLDGIIADGKELPDSSLHSPLHFDAGTRSLKIFFSLPIWTNQTNIVTEYRLLGLSDRWQPVDYTKQNFLEFGNLPAGNFELQVRAKSAVYRSHPVDLSLSFGIATPWYETGLFYFFVLGVLTLGVIGIFRWRLRYLKRLNQVLTEKVSKQVEAINQQNSELEEQKAELEAQIEEMEAYQAILEKDYALKNRLISIIGHDIITPLRFMNRAFKQLLTRRENISQDTFDETLQIIFATGMGLEDMAVNMLSWIKHHQETAKFVLSDFDLREKMDQIVQNLQPMAELKRLGLVNEIPKGLFAHQYVDPLKTVVLQLLTNSIKYSDEGAIVISAVKEGEELLLSVTDTGIGMPPWMAGQLTGTDETAGPVDYHENSGHGFGFLIVRDMLRIIGGEVLIESAVNFGTKITIRFPAEAVPDTAG